MPDHHNPFCLLLLFLVVLFSFSPPVYTQTVTVRIENTTALPDEEVYVAVVGEDLSGPPGKYVWVDLLTGQQNPMSIADNTIDGPVYSGDLGPGQNGKYADCFFPLSELQNHTFPLEQIQGCRIFLSQKEQLYLYFFDQQSVFGYSAPNRLNPNDPNQGIIYEIIELTLNQYGFFGNTTRVDAYQRPIGMELAGASGTYLRRVGEALPHQEIIAAFASSVPHEFLTCLSFPDSLILQPSKTPQFMPGGVHENYFQPYVDAIWEKYKSDELLFDSGAKGIWSGSVTDGDTFHLTCIQGAPGIEGRKAMISRKPDTQEVFEGKGVLNQPHGDPEMDLAMQAQFCAALNRHIIDVLTPSPGLQDWSDPSSFYLASPANHYAGYWHRKGISIDQLSYGFAYDDVWEQSSSLHSPQPDSLVVYFGTPNRCEIHTAALDIAGSGPSEIINPGIYQATEYITARGNIESGSEIDFVAGQSIILTEFSVPQGGSFSAKIQPCQPVSQIQSPPFSQKLNADAHKSPHVFQVFPNPSSGIIQIHYGLQSIEKLSVYIVDAKGSALQTLEQNTTVFGSEIRTYDLQSLHAGFYWMIFQTSNQTDSQPFILTY